MNYGAWIEWAQREKAALFILEHRYYGESHPKPTLTTEDMKWLSSRQVLGEKYNNKNDRLVTNDCAEKISQKISKDFKKRLEKSKID